MIGYLKALINEINNLKSEEISSLEVKEIKAPNTVDVYDTCLIIHRKNDAAIKLLPREDYYSGNGGWFEISYYFED